MPRVQSSGYLLEAGERSGAVAEVESSLHAHRNGTRAKAKRGRPPGKAAKDQVSPQRAAARKRWANMSKREKAVLLDKMAKGARRAKKKKVSPATASRQMSNYWARMTPEQRREEMQRRRAVANGTAMSINAAA